MATPFWLVKEWLSVSGPVRIGMANKRGAWDGRLPRALLYENIAIFI